MMKNRSDTRDTPPRVGSPLWVYVTVVTAAGLAVLVLAVTSLGLGELRVLAGRPLWWMLAILVICGELRPILTPGRKVPEAAAASITFTFAALLYWGLPAAALLQVAAVVIAGAVARRATFRNAFNAAQYSVSLGAGALVLAVARVHPSPASPWVMSGSQVTVVAIAALAFFVTNVALVDVAVAVHNRVPVAETVRADLPYQLMVNGALLAAAPLVVVVMAHSAVLVPLFLLPLAAVYANAAMSLQREHQAHHDELTSLPNRKLLVLRTEEALADAVRNGRRAGLLLLDLDRFKEVNDTLGHPTGDRMLRAVAHRLTHSVRPGDVVARLGGDEFAVLLPSLRDRSAAREVAVRLRAALAEPIRMEGMSFGIEASIGIALHPDHAPDFELLLQRADVAMYLAKERKTGVEEYISDSDRNSPARLRLLGDLRRAPGADQLELYFQPKVALAGGHPAGVEALLRWRHPVEGMIPPGEFIPMAERSYLMRDLTRWVVEAAIAQAARWRRAGLATQVAVNVSPTDLLDATLAEVVSAALQRHGVPAEGLLLEITEQVLMGEPAAAVECLGQLARCGVPLSLDDFGTGYSSLTRLRRLPVSEIKIDSSFVGRLAESPDDRVIVGSLVELVRALGIDSVAEGVETAEVAGELQEMGCDYAQGWYFCEPLSAADATAWLRSRLEPGRRPRRGSRQKGTADIRAG
jgi:diguanylate cyclase (GGDEF)-like protein